MNFFPITRAELEIFDKEIIIKLFELTHHGAIGVILLTIVKPFLLLFSPWQLCPATTSHGMVVTLPLLLELAYVSLLCGPCSQDADPCNGSFYEC